MLEPCPGSLQYWSLISIGSHICHRYLWICYSRCFVAKFLPQFTRFHVEKNWAKRTFVEEKWQLSGLLLISSIPSHLMRLTCCKTRNVMWIWVSMAKVGWEWGRVPRLGVFCQAPITLDFLPTPCSRPTPTLNHLGTQIRGRFENWRKTSNEITKCNINYAVFF